MSARRRPLRRPGRRTRGRPRAAVVRRGLLLGLTTLPLVALVVLASVKILAMSLLAQLAVWFTDAGEYKAALTVSEWNLVANWYEPYKAHYNVGTAMLHLELYDDARDHLSYALRLEPPVPDSCWVRTNLSLAIEGQGDYASANEQFDTAALYYAQAKAFLEAADPACASESSSESESEDESEGGGGGGGEDEQGGGGGGGQDEESDGGAGGGEDEQSGGGTFGEQSAESQERLDEKQQQAESDLEQQQQQQEQEQQEQPQGGGGGESEPEEGEDGSGSGGGGGTDDGQDGQAGGNPFGDLGERMEQAERDRQRGTGIDRSKSGSNPYPAKPW